MLTINNGNIIIDSDVDGIDVNGNTIINDGTITIYGPENSGNGALDYDGYFAVNGGTLLAGGSRGMAMNISENSNTYGIHIGVSGNQEISINDESRNTIITYVSNKNFQSLVIASDKLEKDAVYTVYQGDEKLGEVTVSNTLNTLGNVQTTGCMFSSRMPQNSPNNAQKPKEHIPN